ncbi:unnamed protein product, partial [Iphiclides podalirius]
MGKRHVRIKFAHSIGPPIDLNKLDSRSNPLLSEEPKEQNNNNLLSVAGGQATKSAAANGTAKPSKQR